MNTKQLNEELEKIELAMSQNLVKSKVADYHMVASFPNAKTYFVEAVNGSQFHIQIEDIGASHIEQIN